MLLKLTRYCGENRLKGTPAGRRMTTVLAGLAVLLTASAGGCRNRHRQMPPLPPATVMVSTPVSREITEYLEATGNTAALESVVVQARVKGFLESMHFTPEQKVKKDQQLFVIDPRPFEVALEQAKGQLELRQAEARFAEYDLSRMTKLQAQDAAAEREERQSRAKMEEAQASVVIAQSAVDDAKLNLDFAHVKAPIAGRISRNLVDIGNLINPGQDQLATITNDDSVYAYFNVSEQDVLRLSRMYGGERRKAASQPDHRAQSSIPASLALMDESDFPHSGVIDYVAPTLDSSTGTISIRAVFPNSDGFLRAGYFVRVRVPVSKPRTALLVAEQALGMDQGQYYVLVVNDRNKVEYRRVRTGILDKGMRVIEEGLSANEHVIVIGLQRVRPGAEVKAETVSMESVTQVTTRPAAKAATKPAASTDTAH